MMKFFFVRIAPKYVEMSKKYTDVDFYKVDVDVGSEISEQQGIR